MLYISSTGLSQSHWLLFNFELTWVSFYYLVFFFFPLCCQSFVPILVMSHTFSADAKHERVTGRKARGPHAEEIGCKCQIFFISLLSCRRKQTTSVRFFFPSLYKIKRRFLKILCCHDKTWFPPELNLIFLMEMFFLSYVNELCI